MPCSISAFLSDCLQSVWHSLGPSMLLQMASFHSSVAEWYSIVYMYSVFFIHLSVGRHLGCFCVLGFCKQCCNEYWGMCIFSRFYAIVNNAAVSIRVLCIFWRYLHFLVWDFFFFVTPHVESSFPNQWLCPLHWKHRVLPLDHERSPDLISFTPNYLENRLSRWLRW